jgi:hypothetical protein
LQVLAPHIFTPENRTEIDCWAGGIKSQYDSAFSEPLHPLFSGICINQDFCIRSAQLYGDLSMVIAANLHKRAARGRFWLPLQRPTNEMAKKVIFTLACAAGIALAAVQYMEMLGVVQQRCVIGRTVDAPAGCPGE